MAASSSTDGLDRSLLGASRRWDVSSSSRPISITKPVEQVSADVQARRRQWDRESPPVALRASRLVLAARIIAETALAIVVERVPRRC